MWFLIKTTFWVGLVLLFLPFGDEPLEGNQSSASRADMLHAAQGLVTDVSGICARSPEVCSVGGEALRIVGQKAKYGAKSVYQFLDVALADQGSAGPAISTDSSLYPMAHNGAVLGAIELLPEPKIDFQTTASLGN